MTDAATVVASDVRSGCHGELPLTGRLESWQQEACRSPEQLAAWLDEYGSPLNIIDPTPMAANAAELSRVAARVGVDMRIFFARKANKALALVDQALRLGLGVDVASERELRQTLDRGAHAADVIVTAAVKPRPLIELCVDSGATVTIDNEDELRLLGDVAQAAGRRVPVALRLAPELARGRPLSRFGIDGAGLLAMVDRHWPDGAASQLAIVGVHFHLDGYDPQERSTAIAESMRVIDALRERGHAPTFIDFGGGIPMSYLDDSRQWHAFWRAHRAALLGQRAPLTFDGHGLGLVAHRREIIGRANVYPYHQTLTRGAWLGQVLDARVDDQAPAGTIAQAVRQRGLQLRCEPGRSLVDGCGLTAARVEFCKQRADGTTFVGLAMNRTQCRSTSEDFLVDPLLVRPGSHDGQAIAEPGAPTSAYLVGAYCIERELLTWRRLHFPGGVRTGDIIVFPNTAGYLMHILESASHQIPLARNLIVGATGAAQLDAIDS